MPRRHVTNKEIADILAEIGLFHEAEGVPFKPKAYETAADMIRALDEELASMYGRCGITCIDDLPGIGASIAEKIKELVTTGHLASYEQLKKEYPVDLPGITAIQNIGPKTALALYKKLKIKTVADLERAAKAGTIAGLPGFGKKTQENILQSIAFLQKDTGRFLLHQALPLSLAIVAKLKPLPGVTHCEAAGSIRRRKETIGDIDILITTSKPNLAIEKFKSLPEIERVTEEGPTKIGVRYRAGINGDLRILKPDEYGSALLYFTGSKEHNVNIRELAVKKGWKLSEYGLFSAKRGSAPGGKGNKRIAGKTEEEIYKKFGMEWIPPEIREAHGEIEAAMAGKLPDLIPYGSIKGDLQVQTDWTDGSHSIEDMAAAAKKHGLSYIAVTDHTKSLAMTGGLNEKRLLAQGKEIDRLNKKLSGFRVLKSTECDIKKDGSLDLTDAALKTLDLVCVSVHSHFSMGTAEMTERIIRAMKHPLVHILFHPTGRILKQRDPYRLDLGKVIRAAKQYHVALEVNASERLDLSDLHIRQAIAAGIKLVINSDAHAPEHFKNIDFGVAQARRGWATKADVLNTKPVEAFLKALKKKKK